MLSKRGTSKRTTLGKESLPLRRSDGLRGESAGLLDVSDRLLLVVAGLRIARDFLRLVRGSGDDSA